MLNGPCRVAKGDRFDTKFSYVSRTLCECFPVAVNTADIFEKRTFVGDEAVPYRLEIFGGDREAASGKEVMDIGYPAGGRIFDREEGINGLAALHGADDVFKRGESFRGKLREHCFCSDV